MATIYILVLLLHAVLFVTCQEAKSRTEEMKEKFKTEVMKDAMLDKVKLDMLKTALEHKMKEELMKEMIANTDPEKMMVTDETGKKMKSYMMKVAMMDKMMDDMLKAAVIMDEIKEAMSMFKEEMMVSMIQAMKEKNKGEMKSDKPDMLETAKTEGTFS